MNFGTSQAPINKVLLRRNASATPDEIQDESAPSSDPQHDPSIPVADEETIVLPTPSHKRKQSDVAVLSQLDISNADVRAAYARYSSLSPIEQGTAADAEDSDDACGYDGGIRQWKNPLSPLLSPCQLIAIFMVLGVLTTLHSVRSRSNKNAIIEDPYYEGGFEEVGGPLEAQLPQEEWTEFFSSPDRMPHFKSAGPWLVDEKIGGLHKFENVCVTNNIDAPKPPEMDTSSRGILYFTKDKVMRNNPKRCVPCSKKQMDSRMEDHWDATSDSDSDLGHRCGMKGLHAMFAHSVSDYNKCMADTENHKVMIRAKQNQSPSHVTNIHFFQEPTFLLQFDAHDRENSLFDMLMTYLPHWHKFRNGYEFPFENVISHSVQGCLTHSRSWFCELTHQMGAFGFAQELQWERKDTLYCFKSLYYNQLGYQRELNHEGLLTKDIMDDFRDEVFRNMGLPSPRDLSEVRSKDAKLGMKRPLNIALYANGAWDGLDKLVSTTKSMKKYKASIEFNLIDNFDDLTIAEQANAFNLADALVMATGDHTANAIFTPDDSYFAEVGCHSESLIGNKKFMSLILGTQRSVTKCTGGDSEDEICVSCNGKSNFSMTGAAFRALLDDIMKQHEDKVQFQRDSLR